MDNSLLSEKEKLIKIAEYLNDSDLHIADDDRLNIERIVDQKEASSYNKVLEYLSKK